MPPFLRSDLFETKSADMSISALPLPELLRIPVPWQTVANTFYNAPLVLRYEDLPPAATVPHWKVVVVYNRPNVYYASPSSSSSEWKLPVLRSTPDPLVTLTANSVLVHGPMKPPSPQNRIAFDVPDAAMIVNGSTLTLKWEMPADVRGSGTGCYVAEVLLQPR